MLFMLTRTYVFFKYVINNKRAFLLIFLDSLLVIILIIRVFSKFKKKLNNSYLN